MHLQEVKNTKTPKEFANELANKMYRGNLFTKTKKQHLKECEEAKQAALIVVDEFLILFKNMPALIGVHYVVYYNEVKEEINKL